MRLLTLILLPWIVYGGLSFLGWWKAGINIAISFTIEGIYFAVLFAIDWFECKYGNNEEPETAMERAKRVIG